MSRGIFPPDQRSVIDPGSPLFPLFPFPAVTAIDVLTRTEVDGGIEFADGFGSGITIAHNYVLTNTHVLYGFDLFDPNIDEITVRVSTSEKQQLLIDRRIEANDTDPGSNVINIHLDDAYLQTGEYDDDIALLRTNNRLLNEDEVIGIIAFVNPQDAVGFAAETAGYPFDNVSQPIPGNSGDEGRDLVVAPASPFLGNVVSTFSERLYTVDSNIDVFQGQSGSGIWSSYQGDPLRIFGLINFNVEGDPPPPRRQGGNGGILITTDLYDEIMAQVEADSGTANANLLPENLIIGSDPGFFSSLNPFSSAGDDVIIGTYRRERIIGNKGNDRLFGGGAFDRLEGGEGVDQALFSDSFTDSNNSFNYRWEITNPGNIENPEFKFEHDLGFGVDGIDTTKDIEFAVFEFVDENGDRVDDDGKLFYVPLQVDPNNPEKLKDGPEITPETDILDEDGNKLGEMTVTSPAWMFDGDVEYKLNIGSEQGTLYNFAYIIDTSGSMYGSNIAAAKSAYRSLTQYLVDENIAQQSQFGVVDFDFTASLTGPVGSFGAMTRIIVGNDLDNNFQIQYSQNTIFGNGGNDRFILNGGVNLVDGGEGIDTVEFELTQAETGNVSKNGNVVNIGIDTTALNIEYIKFSDVLLDVDTLLATPVISFADRAITVQEGNTESSFATFTLNLSSVATEEIVIDVTLQSDDATSGIDFLEPSTSLTIEKGETTGNVTLEIVGDTDVEGDEEVFLDFKVASGATFALGKTSEIAGVNIVDNDKEISIFATERDLAIFEGDSERPSTLNLNLERFGSLIDSDTVQVELIPTGDNPVEASDFVKGLTPMEVTFATGENSKTIELAVASDSTVEADETFGVKITSVSGSALIPNQDLVFTILNDDIGNSIVGTADKDHLIGTSEVDIIEGLDGKDKIYGNNGNDYCF